MIRTVPTWFLDSDVPGIKYMLLPSVNQSQLVRLQATPAVV